MSKNDKRLAYIGAAVIVALLLWLLLRGGAVFARGGGANTLPANEMGPTVIDGGGPITIPGLYLGGRDLQIIGSCCMDCAGGARPTNVAPPVRNFSYVTNLGGYGPTIYNIDNSAAPSTAYSGWGKMASG